MLHVVAEGRFTKFGARIVVPALTELEALARLRNAPGPLLDAWRTYERSIDALVRKRLAA